MMAGAGVAFDSERLSATTGEASAGSMTGVDVGEVDDLMEGAESGWDGVSDVMRASKAGGTDSLTIRLGLVTLFDRLAPPVGADLGEAVRVAAVDGDMWSVRCGGSGG